MSFDLFCTSLTLYNCQNRYEQLVSEKRLVSERSAWLTSRTNAVTPPYFWAWNSNQEKAAVGSLGWNPSFSQSVLWPHFGCKPFFLHLTHISYTCLIQDPSQSSFHAEPKYASKLDCMFDAADAGVSSTSATSDQPSRSASSGTFLETATSAVRMKNETKLTVPGMRQQNAKLLHEIMRWSWDDMMHWCRWSHKMRCF